VESKPTHTSNDPLVDLPPFPLHLEVFDDFVDETPLAAVENLLLPLTNRKFVDFQDDSEVWIFSFGGNEESVDVSEDELDSFVDFLVVLPLQSVEFDQLILTDGFEWLKEGLLRSLESAL
jgi:hypothetical protein